MVLPSSASSMMRVQPAMLRSGSSASQSSCACGFAANAGPEATHSTNIVNFIEARRRTSCLTMLSRMNARSSVPQGAGLAATASAACDHCHIEGIVLSFLYQVVEATLSHSFFGRRMEAVPVLKLLALVIALIIAAMVAGAYRRLPPFQSGDPDFHHPRLWHL